MERNNIVVKFGGSSMCKKGYATALDRVNNLVKNNYRVTVVVSAVGKTTNALMDIVNLKVSNIDKIREINGLLLTELNFHQTLLDDEFTRLEGFVNEFLSDPSADLTQSRIKILSMGEIMSSVIMYHYLSIYYTREKLGLINARHFIKSKKHSGQIDPKTLHMGGEFFCDESAFNKIFDKSLTVAVTQGYIATTDDNKHCVLSRSGSDTSASLIASAIGAERLEIWTDVNGMYTADPRVVPCAKVIPEIDYKICCEASASGSHVLHPYCIEPCMNKNIPIYVKNTFDPDGVCTVVKNFTTIGSKSCGKIHTIAQQKNVTLFNVKSDMWQSAGATGDVFRVFSEYCVDVDIITTSHTSISTTTEEMNIIKLNNVYEELSKKFQVEMIGNCTIVSIVADNARTNCDINNAIAIVNSVCSKCCNTNNGNNGNNGNGCFYIRHYSSDDMNLSFVVNSNYADELVREFHKAYLEHDKNITNITDITNITNITNIGVNGHKGRLGSLIVNNIPNMPNMNFNKDHICVSDVIIDVSSPEGTVDLIKMLHTYEKKVPLVIGTTGHCMKEINIIKEYSKYAPVALIPNFSKGIPLFEKFIQSIKDTGKWTATLLDDHHKLKKDSPSGTAKRLIAAYSGKLDVQSKREGDTIGTHILELDSPTEKLVIQHIAKDRRIFAEGAIEYCKWIIGQKAGFYTEMSSPLEHEPNLMFAKYESAGNDFLITTMENHNSDTVTEFVKKYCNRNTGIGADGMIFVDTNPLYTNDTNDPNDTNDTQIRWEIYNCDGSIAEMCGNGAVCCLKYLYDNKIYGKNTRGLRGNYKLINSFFTTECCYEDGKSHIYFPFPKDFTKQSENVFTLTMGVPHAVKFPEIWGSMEPDEPKFNNLYEGVYNMNTVQGIMEYSYDCTVKVRTFERGVNAETLACGTGCCATAYCLYQKYNVDNINIHTQSGKIVRVEIFSHDESIGFISCANHVFNTYPDRKEKIEK